ncbi:DNA mismatch repair protein msh6 [Coprinopsis cinerea okayama7|uniref:DNA mismatch repair protein n=1 Tax=Coprinopsis cinerea (strain Okayama-7 / 130 / ATCC MYA-4618 / FGSC 9003) TaxID=240176 RepID=A8NC53_COPC7|nr:DNA mismatch repair protein msh6 [Coprinopsis cinerea okayama7\|eukprot:XP_001832397.2 DNA mismatch repair protein msh6 [Coprinopsis cinerea okayama7\
MPPKPKASTESLKQKSLMSFFAKAPAGGSSSSSKTEPKPKAKPTATPVSNGKSDAMKPRETMPPSSPLAPKTPESKGMDTRMLNSSAAASSTSSRIMSTPPTSDPIDIDMLSSDGELELVPSKVPRSVPSTKRKSVIESDEDEEPLRPTGKSRRARRDSSPSEAAQRKRARLSKALSEAESDDGEASEALSSFSQRLSRFKKSPVKKRSKKRVDDDDDDFIVPDSESEDDAKSMKSASSRSFSSRRSAASSEDEDFEELSDDEPKRSKTKKAPAKKNIAKPSAPATGTSSGGNSFLTAAEQRAQDKKVDKQKAEAPFSFLQDIRDKDGRRPGEPDYDPRTIYIPKKAWAEFTPFEKQFWEIKQNHYDTVLFFQKGKFFELYEDDARIGHQEFDLKLTSRVKMSMVGVPESSFNFWAAKFLGKGYKVGRVEQAETALGAEMRMAAAKGKGKVSEDKAKDKIVRRELNKVYTNGTLVDDALLTDENAGHCIAICEQPCEDGSDSANKFGICVLDCSTSQFNLTGFVDDICRTKLETLLRQICPKELLFYKGSFSVDTQRVLKAVLPSDCLWTGLREVEGFKYDDALKALKDLFPSEEDAMEEDEGEAQLLPPSVPESIRKMATDKCAIEALGSMIWYLRQLNIDKDIVTMRNFNIYDPMERNQGLVLDGQTLAHLEILLNNEGSEDGSLFHLLRRCITPFGKRLFRIWLCMPLREVSAINARLDAVEDIMKHPTFESSFSELAKGIPDLERIVSRIHAKNCKVKDFLKVLSTFKSLSRGLAKLADESEEFESKTILGLLRGAPDLLVNVRHLESMFEKPSDKDRDELKPVEGKDEEYDGIVREIRSLERDLDKSLKAFEKETGLDLDYWHSAIGTKDIYLVETSAKNADDVPDDWAKNRYSVPSLQPTIRKLKEARENLNTAVKNFKFRLYAEFDKDRSQWLRAIRVFAELDCLFSLAKASAAIGSPSCRPEFIEGDSAFIEFEDLRHPTICLNRHIESFVENDVKMGGEDPKIILLTGPNMAGKSTLMRMTSIGVIMAQLGMLVPASRARLCPVDSIITRMGAYDNMFTNSSTFKIELDECCKILRNATPKSLVILDELGRGTSTFDGMAIAGSVLHKLATHTLPLAFFATHYGSLTDDYAYHPNIRRMHMSTMVDEERQQLTFLYKLVDGAATSSFGSHVARLAGVPDTVVERADDVSAEFAKQFKERLQLKKKQSASSRVPLVAQADFVYMLKLATGQIAVPEDPALRKELFTRLQSVLKAHKASIRA